MHDHENCQEMLSSLSMYIDGEASQAVCEEIERHLQVCDNCRVLVNTLKKTIELYQVHDEDQVLPEGVRERLFHKLHLDDLLIHPSNDV